MIKMIRLTILFVCISAAFAASLPLNLEDRILGGSPAAPGQFPYQVSLRYTQGSSHACGGSILNSRFVLTAAHCIYQNRIGEHYVVVGTNYLNSGGQSYQIENGVYHAGFSPNHFQNDIAILKVRNNIQFNNYVQPIALQTSEVPAGAPLVLSGWGLTSYPSHVIPNNLQYATLTAIDTNTCKRLLQPSEIINSQICTLTRAGQGACNGDSGGPLVYAGRVAGIVSWGRPCAIGYPDVFTKVSAFNAWIEGGMGVMMYSRVNGGSYLKIESN